MQISELKAVKAVIKCKDYYFLQHRDYNKKILYPGHWSFFGGRIKKNENLKKAIARELKEELFFQLSSSKFLNFFFNKETKYKIFFFEINFNNWKSFIVNEGIEGKWIYKNDIKNLKLAPDANFIFYKKFLKKNYINYQIIDPSI